MKYKNVPVTGMTIWQLGQAVSEGGEFYDEYGDQLYIEKDFGVIESDTYDQGGIVNQLSSGKITAREPVQWYDELPKLVYIEGDQTGLPSFATTLNRDGSKVAIVRLGYIDIDRCTPLTTEEATKYGV